MEPFIPEPVEQAGRLCSEGKGPTARGALGLCRYLTIRQVIELGVGAKTEKATGYRLRGSACEGDKVRGASVEARALERLSLPFLRGRAAAPVGPDPLWASPRLRPSCLLGPTLPCLSEMLNPTMRRWAVERLDCDQLA